MLKGCTIYNVLSNYSRYYNTTIMIVLKIGCITCSCGIQMTFLWEKNIIRGIENYEELLREWLEDASSRDEKEMGGLWKHGHLGREEISSTW